jgi:hypothetical protein
LSEQSLEKIYSYILKKKRLVSSLELVQSVLKLENAASSVANNLIQSLVKDDSRFLQTMDGNWHVVQTPVRQQAEWVLCKIFPSSTDWRMIAEIHCARLHKNSNVDSISFAKVELAHNSAQQILTFISNSPIVLDGIGNQLSTLRQYVFYHTGQNIDNSIFLLTNLVKKLFPRQTCKCESDISHLLDQTSFVEALGAIRFEEFQHQTIKIFEMLKEKDVQTLDDLLKFHSTQQQTPDFESDNIDSEFWASAPESPGVYIMRNKHHDVIYVGKAVNLKRRLKSYFVESIFIDEKLENIRKNLDDIELIKTGSELEALLLEFKLIAKHRPEINSQQKVHARAFLEQQRFPQIIFLPAVDENNLTLILFNPSHSINLILSSRIGLQPKGEDDIKITFFVEPTSAVNKNEEEIITSWLSKNHEKISRIDMRMVPSFEEALRLIRLHLENFSDFEKIIQI